MSCTSPAKLLISEVFVLAKLTNSSAVKFANTFKLSSSLSPIHRRVILFIPDRGLISFICEAWISRVTRLVRSGYETCLYQTKDTAIKYANTGKKIEIEAYIENRYAVVNICDFGKTIDKKHSNNLFKRYVQMKKTNGHGLGLAIVKRIAIAHNAEVGVKPNNPDGNNFYLKIPVS